jgi:predicted ATPase
VSQLIHRITLKQLLSFDEEGIDLAMRPLNVLIGPNGSGKSNLIEAVSLFQSAPGELASTVRDGGGISDWLWKGTRRATASIEMLVENPLRGAQKKLRHTIRFTESARRLELVDERIEEESTRSETESVPYFFYKFQNSRPVLNVPGEDTPRSLKREDVDPEKSILAQRKDPDQYPEITYLADSFSRIKIYREWIFGRYTPPRQPQKADKRNDFLDEDCANLGLVLNSIRRDIDAKQAVLDNLKSLYPAVQDFDVIIEGGTVQVFLQEGKFSIPATRLSDGTLRYLCLLAILCHPKPPPLICIEEPELGLHPDVLVSVGKLLKGASKKTQLIVTTHSDVLVDCMSDDPEDVIVCEKTDAASTMRRLDSDDLKDWLDKYSLGELWRRGEIGGNRW